MKEYRVLDTLVRWRHPTEDPPALWDEVLRYMASCAIRDRVTYIQSITPDPEIYGEPDESTKAQIAKTKAELRDFRKLAGFEP